MRRGLNFSHLATRCTTTSSGPLLRDSTLLPKSTSQLQTGDSTQQSRTFYENFEFSFFLFCFSFFFFSLNAKLSGTVISREGCFPPSEGGGQRDSREEYISSLDGMPSSHTLLGPWLKTSSRGKALEAEIAPRLICKISDFSGVLCCRGFSFLSFFSFWWPQIFGNWDTFGMWQRLK